MLRVNNSLVCRIGLLLLGLATHYLQLLYRENVIPKAAVTNYYNLGIELDISGDDIRAIEQDVKQANVVKSARDMLVKWLESPKGGIASELIKAIHESGLVTYAASLQAELDKDKKVLITEKDLTKIIPNIATHWTDVGINLGIEHLDVFAEKTELTEEKFRRTLKLWLQSNPKPVDELLDMFYKALKGIDLFTAAERFKMKAEGLKMKVKDTTSDKKHGTSNVKT